MGGPIKKDKAFFFGSVQRYSAEYDPSGPRHEATEISPRFNVKLTLQPTSSDTIIARACSTTQYNVTGRVGYWPTDQATDNATVEEDAPEWVWNAQYRKVFGSSTLLEAKLHRVHRLLLPRSGRSSPLIYDGGNRRLRRRRRRNLLRRPQPEPGQRRLTQYAEKFGHHSFKFGAEIERSHVRSQYQPYGPAGFYIYQYGGVPYYQVQLRLRPAGRQPPDVGVRAGPVELPAGLR